jgi:hypothetical protein
MGGAKMRKYFGRLFISSALVQALGFLKLSGCLIIQASG